MSERRVLQDEAKHAVIRMSISDLLLKQIDRCHSAHHYSGGFLLWRVIPECCERPSEPGFGVLGVYSLIYEVTAILRLVLPGVQFYFVEYLSSEAATLLITVSLSRLCGRKALPDLKAQ